MVHRVTHLREGSRPHQRPRIFISSIGELHQIVRTHMFQKEMKCMTMVMMSQMTEFMKQDIVPESFRQTDYIQIEIDVSPYRTTSPVSGIMLNRNFIVYEAITCRKSTQTFWKFVPSLHPPCFYLFLPCLGEIFITLFLSGNSIEYPFSLQTVKRDCCREWHKIRHSDIHSPYRMDTDTKTTATFAFAENYSAQLRVVIDMFQCHLTYFLRVVTNVTFLPAGTVAFHKAMDLPCIF